MFLPGLTQEHTGVRCAPRGSWCQTQGSARPRRKPLGAVKNRRAPKHESSLSRNPRSEAGSGDGKLFRSPPTVSGIILNFKPDPKRGTCTQLHLHEINHVSLGEIFTAWDRHPGPCRALEDGGDLGDGPVLCKSSSRSSDATPLPGLRLLPWGSILCHLAKREDSVWLWLPLNDNL